MLKAHIYPLLCVLLSLLSASAGADGKSQGQLLQFRGSSTVLTIMQRLKPDLEQRLGIHTHIEGGGSVTGLEALLAGRVDIAMVSRALGTRERETLDFMTIALDGVAVIVNRNNPLPRLSRQQIIDIFIGRTVSWKGLGGTDLPIQVLAKDQHRSTREVFDAYFGLQGRIRATRYVGSNTEMIVLVGTSPRSIGYVSIGSLEAGLSHGVPVRALELEGLQASVHNVAIGSWPMRRELNLVWRRDRAPPKLAELRRFMSSKKVREAIAAAHFVPPVQARDELQP